MKVGLFCTGGHTEMGGLQRFLERAFPGVFFERCFPARDRRRPLSRPLWAPEKEERPAPRPQDEGVTGEGLVLRMLEIIARHHARGEYSAYLLVDDADCRFCESGISGWREQLRRRLQAEVPSGEAPLHLLFAFQEVETWLLADWNGTFAQEFPAISHDLRKSLLLRFGLGGWEQLETVGCPQNSSGEGCTRKISEEVQEEIKSLRHSGLSYSKRIHGQNMLQRLDPAAVASLCPQFRSDVLEIRAALCGTNARIL